METTYFILGALTVVTLIAVAGVVKMFSSVSQLREKVEKLQRSLDDEIRGTQREFNDSIRDTELAIREIANRITETEKYIDSRYDKLSHMVKQSMLEKNLVNTK